MSLYTEFRKLKRTCFFPAFAAGGVLSAAFPVLNMAVRSELFTAINAPAIQILMENNWEMMVMLNLLLLITGACILYHIEYAENGIQKMQALPLREASLFFGKAALLVPAFALMAVIEAASLIFCGARWFNESAGTLISDAAASLGFAFLLTLPALILSLMISSLCQNMWTMLGIGVLCVFTASMLPADSFLASLFPYAMPFQILPGMETEQITRYCIAAAAETAVLGSAELIILKTRRLFA